MTCLFSTVSRLDVEHRKSFAEMTEAQVHPASSASAPEGFLQSQDNPNGNEHSTGTKRLESYRVGSRSPSTSLSIFD